MTMKVILCIRDVLRLLKIAKGYKLPYKSQSKNFSYITSTNLNEFNNIFKTFMKSKVMNIREQRWMGERKKAYSIYRAK